MTKTDSRNPDRVRLDTILTGEQQVRIWLATNAMPFAADLRLSPHTLVTGDDIALFLEQLTPILRDHADRHRQLEDEHAALKRDVAAVRRVFGTHDNRDT